MKRLLVCAATMTVAIAAFAWAKQANSASSSNQIVGTWKLESADYSGQPKATGITQIKMISKNRYLWLQYDPAKNKTQAAGTGSYMLNGNSYTEHVDLLDVNSSQGNPYVGKDLTFTIKVEGDTLTQTGNIGPMSLKETWRRTE
jgi:hypothetical protein